MRQTQLSELEWSYLDAEKGVLCCVADVTCSDHVNTGTKASIVDSSNNWLITLLDSCERSLEVLQCTVKLDCPTHYQSIQCCMYLDMASSMEGTSSNIIVINQCS